MDKKKTPLIKQIEKEIEGSQKRLGSRKAGHKSNTHTSRGQSSDDGQSENLEVAVAGLEAQLVETTERQDKLEE